MTGTPRILSPKAVLWDIIARWQWWATYTLAVRDGHKPADAAEFAKDANADLKV